MINNYMTRRLNRIEQILNSKDKNNLLFKLLYIVYENRAEHSNKNKKYYIQTNDVLMYKPDADIKPDTELVYDNLDDFYKEFNLYPDKDIRLIIFNTIDTTETEKAFWNIAKED